jgi:ornithine carbamoyltransferase
MASNLHGKSILALDDFAPTEIQYLLDLAKVLSATEN